MPLSHSRTLWKALREKTTVYGYNKSGTPNKAVLVVPQFWLEYKMKTSAASRNAVECGLVASQIQAKWLGRHLEYNSNSASFGASVTLSDSTVRIHMLSWDGDEESSARIHFILPFQVPDLHCRNLFATQPTPST